MIKDGVAICHPIRDESIEFLSSIKPELGGTSSREEFCLVAVDFLFRYPVALLIGFALRIQSLDASFVEELANRVTSGKLYGKTPVSRPILTEIEGIYQKRRAEMLVEGRAITPIWFFRQLIAARLIRDVQETLSDLIQELEDYATAEFAVWSENKSILVIGQAACSGVEVCKKLQVHMDLAKKYVATLDRFKTVPDESWPSVRWAELRASVEAIKKRLVNAGAERFRELRDLRTEQARTDFFGQIYTITARESFNALSEGDVDYFEELFPKFFAGAVLAFEDEGHKVHESPYIQAIAGGPRMLSGHAGDLFVAVYLMPRVTDPAIKAPGGAQSFARRFGKTSFNSERETK